MDPASLLSVWGLGLLVWTLLLIGIISAGSMPKRRDRIQLQNQKLLALIAGKLGVEAREITDITSQGNYATDLSQPK